MKNKVNHIKNKKTEQLLSAVCAVFAVCVITCVLIFSAVNSKNGKTNIPGELIPESNTGIRDIHPQTPQTATNQTM